MLLHYPLTGGEGSPAGHVLAGGVTGAVIEAGEHDVVGVVLLYFVQLADRGRRFRHRLDLLEMLLQPDTEIPGLPGAGKDKCRCPLHGLARHGGDDAAALPSHFHPAVVAGQHGALHRGHGHEKFTLGVLAVYQQRSSQAYRYLRHAENVLDVAGHVLGVERELPGVVQPGRRILFDECLTLGDDVSAVVVLVGTGYFLAHCGLLLIFNR